MRQAGWDSGWHLDANGEVIGFSLHGDACAEHEIGIGELKASLGITKDPHNGVADRTNTVVPNGFIFHTYQEKDGTPAAYLMVNDRSLLDVNTIDPLTFEREARFRTISIGGRILSEDQKADDLHRSRFGAAWDSRGFFIRVKGLGYIDRLKKMAKAIETKDLALGGYLVERVYENGKTRVGGLTLVRASRVSPQMAADLLAADQSTSAPAVCKTPKP